MRLAEGGVCRLLHAVVGAIRRHIARALTTTFAMWKAGRKSRTKNPYGKKRKKSNLENLRGRSTPARSDEGDSDRPSVVGDDALVNVGLAPPPTAHNASGSGRIRLDTAMLHPLQVAEVRQNAENKLHELSSTGATQRKCSLLGDPDNAAATPLDETRFVIVSLTQLNELMRAVKCKLCSGDVEIGKEDGVQPRRKASAQVRELRRRVDGVELAAR